MNINRRDTTLTALTLAIAGPGQCGQRPIHAARLHADGAGRADPDSGSLCTSGADIKTCASPKACNTGQDERSDDRSCGDGHVAPQAKAAEPAMQGMDHSQMGHVSPASTPAAPTAQAQSMQGMDHSQMAQPAAADTSGTATPAMQGWTIPDGA
jgi:copper resistance protein B